MDLTERELKKDEDELERVLLKIISIADKIEYVADEISEDSVKNEEVKEKFRLLSGTIKNLAALGDEIEEREEELTEEIEKR